MNLVRWQLENELGYAATLGLEVVRMMSEYRKAVGQAPELEWETAGGPWGGPKNAGRRAIVKGLREQRSARRSVTDLSREVDLLVEAAQRLADRASAPRLDGRKVIADAKRERRKLITDAVRYGL